MKKNDLHKMLGLIDEKILSEADPSKKKLAIGNKSLWVKILGMAVCFLLIFNIAILPAVALIPTIVLGNRIGDMESALDKKDQQIKETIDKKDQQIKDAIEQIQSEKNNPHTQNYYDLYFGQLGGTEAKLTVSSPKTFFPNEYKDVIDAISDLISKREEIDLEELGGVIIDPGDGPIEDAMDKAESDTEDLENSFRDENDEWEDLSDKNENGSLEEKDDYYETTDLQSAGVIEGDIIKRSSSYIYYLRGNLLSVYSINGSLSECVGTANISKIVSTVTEKTSIINDDSERSFGGTAKEMYLSRDGKVVTLLVGSNFLIQGETKTTFVPITMMVSLNVEDPADIYLVNVATLYGRYESSRVIDDEIFVFTKHYASIKNLAVPQYSDGEGFELFKEENIHLGNYSDTTYLLIHRLEQKTLKVNEAGAYLSYDGDIYVTDGSIYLTKKETVVVNNVKKTVTDILRVSYADGSLVVWGHARVDGYIKDRYSLGEYDGFLRVVTTTQYTKYDENGKYLSRTPTNASLYVLDQLDLTPVTSVEGFAPDGETVRSVTFDKYLVYVCTAIEVTDPVFMFDLQDIENITVKKTDTISGFSTSLIEFGSDLLGVGVDSNRNFKLEAYKEDGDKLVSVDYYIVNGNYSAEYKSYYINREAGLFGLGVYDRNSENPNRYIVLHYNGEEIEEIININMSGERSSMRAVWIGDFMYVFSSTSFQVVKLSNDMLGQ